MSPQHAAGRLESRRHIRTVGDLERLAGYGLMGIAFESGDVIALRRFTASTVGPPYIAIWHRDPQLRWTFHTNVEPARSCPRYFWPALSDVRVDDIEIGWRSAWEITFAARRSRLYVGVRLDATPLTRALGVAARSAPERLWRRERIAPLLGPAAGRALRAGQLVLAGTTPSGHGYLMRPLRVWQVRAAVCVMHGRDPGGIVVPEDQPRVGEFLLPARPLFAAGSVDFAPRDAKEADRMATRLP